MGFANVNRRKQDDLCKFRSRISKSFNVIRKLLQSFRNREWGMGSTFSSSNKKKYSGNDLLFHPNLTLFPQQAKLRSLCFGIMNYFYHFLKGNTITGCYCASFNSEPRGTIKIKRHGTTTQGVLFDHAKAPAHRSKVALTAIYKLSFKIFIIHCIHLAPDDFHLFPKLKHHVRGTKFDDDDAITAAVF